VVFFGGLKKILKISVENFPLFATFSVKTAKADLIKHILVAVALNQGTTNAQVSAFLFLALLFAVFALPLRFGGLFLRDLI
jgi:hypothetical protein